MGRGAKAGIEADNWGTELGERMAILIRNGEGGWREPAARGYESEAALQEILYLHPALVPGVTGQSVACREFQSGIGPADVVVLDSEGALTLVECKLAGNPQVRREVIGQILDYASRLWRMPVEAFELAWIRADPNSKSPFDLLGDEEGRIRAALQDNLNAGRLNLVLAVDQLNDDLKRIVEFLNSITTPSTGVIVVEYTRASEGDFEILIPMAYGAELVEAKSSVPSLRRPDWTIVAYQNWCDEHDPRSAPVVRAFITALQSNGFDVLGGRAATPSLNCAFDTPELGRKYPVALYTDTARGALIEVRFPDFKNRPDTVVRLVDAVGDIAAIPIPVAIVRSSGFTKRPNVPAKDFTVDMVSLLAAAVSQALRG
jgi:hypothetical protein